MMEFPDNDPWHDETMSLGAAVLWLAGAIAVILAVVWGLRLV